MELNDLYRDVILDHNRRPRNFGALDAADASVEGFNPLCGDEIVVYLDVEDGVLKNIKMTGSGCSISQSSASLMSAAVKGKPLDQVRATVAMFKELMTVQESTLAHDGEAPKVDIRALGELAALQGVIKFPVRIKCATLAWNTMVQGLDEIP